MFTMETQSQTQFQHGYTKKSDKGDDTMVYTPPTPPNVDGIASFASMYLADGVTPNPSYNASQVTTIKTALQAIQTAFTPSANQLVCDTFYLVSTYNKQNTASPINGDTAMAILAPTGV